MFKIISNVSVVRQIQLLLNLYFPFLIHSLKHEAVVFLAIILEQIHFSRMVPLS